MNVGIIAAIVIILAVIVVGIFSLVMSINKAPSYSISTIISTSVQQTNHTPPSNTSGSSSTTIQTTANQSSVYRKIYVGGPAKQYQQIAVQLTRITEMNGQAYAVLNVSDNGNTGTLFVGAQQYVGWGQNSGSPYIAVDQISTNSNTSSQNWITINITDNIPSGFIEAPNGRGGFSQGSSGSYNSTYNQTAAYNALTGFPTNTPSCNSGNSAYTTFPVPLSYLSDILPLGTVNSHIYPTDHIYLELHQSGGVAVDAPVSSPGNLTVYKIAGVTYKSSSGTRNDYTLYFAGCKSFGGFFAHVSTISGKLLSNYTAPYDSCLNYTADIDAFGLTQISYCIKDTNVKLGAGEQIGYTGGATGSATAMDFQTLDYSKAPLFFANQSRNQGELYIACPLDYFPQNIRNSVYPYVGTDENGVFQTRTVQPICGTIVQDIPGTAQGDWANVQRANSTYPDAGAFALIHDSVVPSKLTFSLGGNAVPGLGSDIWLTFATSSSGYTNRAFSNVTADGHIYCYDSLQNEYGAGQVPGVILLQLLNTSTIRIEYQGRGSCGSNSFTAAHVDFYR